jgi:hypothetical protein
MKIKLLLLLFLFSITTVRAQEKFLKLTDIIVRDSSKVIYGCCGDVETYRITVPDGKIWKITYIQFSNYGNSIASSSYLSINNSRIYQIQDEAVNPNSNQNFSRKSELWLKGGSVLKYIINPSGGGYTTTTTLYLSAQEYELTQ